MQVTAHGAPFVELVSSLWQKDRIESAELDVEVLVLAICCHRVGLAETRAEGQRGHWYRGRAHARVRQPGSAAH